MSGAGDRWEWEVTALWVQDPFWSEESSRINADRRITLGMVLNVTEWQFEIINFL